MGEGLYGSENPPSAQDVIEGRLIAIGLRALELGTNVVIDYGLWSRDERSALRQAAADLGATVELRYFELDGTEPIDEPPAGFATWSEWRAHRWPPSVSVRGDPPGGDTVARCSPSAGVTRSGSSCSD
ncbi:AAA family ATPase [Micromonospora sp. CA-240977]|uniref:AAA family ATPase n=1 Tax=Micromonospora sp. CA-240977 TaxID=3239957 RepID=UPI003D91BB80